MLNALSFINALLLSSISLDIESLHTELVNVFGNVAFDPTTFSVGIAYRAFSPRADDTSGNAVLNMSNDNARWLLGSATKRITATLAFEALRAVAGSSHNDLAQLWETDINTLREDHRDWFNDEVTMSVANFDAAIKDALPTGKPISTELITTKDVNIVDYVLNCEVGSQWGGCPTTRRDRLYGRDYIRSSQCKPTPLAQSADPPLAQFADPPLKSLQIPNVCSWTGGAPYNETVSHASHGSYGSYDDVPPLQAPDDVSHAAPVLKRMCRTPGPCPNCHVNITSEKYMEQRAHHTRITCSQSAPLDDCATVRNASVRARGLDAAIRALRPDGVLRSTTRSTVSKDFGIANATDADGTVFHLRNKRSTDIYAPPNADGRILVYMQFKSSDGFMEDWGFTQNAEQKENADIFTSESFGRFAGLDASSTDWMEQYGLWQLNAALLRLLEEGVTVVTTSEWATYRDIYHNDLGDTYFFRECTFAQDAEASLSATCACTQKNKFWNDGDNPDMPYLRWLFDSIETRQLPGLPVGASLQSTSIMGYSVGALAASRYIEEHARGTAGFPRFASVILLSAGTYLCYQVDSYTCPWGTEYTYDHNYVSNASRPPTLLLSSSHDFDADQKWGEKYFSTATLFESTTYHIETNIKMHGMDVAYIEPLLQFMALYGHGERNGASAAICTDDPAVCVGRQCCFALDATQNADCATLIASSNALYLSNVSRSECDAKLIAGESVKWCGMSYCSSQGNCSTSPRPPIGPPVPPAPPF